MGASLRELLKTDNDQRMRVLQIVPNLGACMHWKPQPCDFEPALRYVQLVEYAVVALASIAIAYRSIQFIRRPRGWSLDDRRALFLTLVTVAAVTTNGFICGMASGPWERYQARVIWLVPMALGLLELHFALVKRKPRPRADDIPRGAPNTQYEPG
jgi:hypothetical protein